MRGNGLGWRREKQEELGDPASRTGKRGRKGRGVGSVLKPVRTATLYIFISNATLKARSLKQPSHFFLYPLTYFLQVQVASVYSFLNPKAEAQSSDKIQSSVRGNLRYAAVVYWPHILPMYLLVYILSVLSVVAAPQFYPKTSVFAPYTFPEHTCPQSSQFTCLGPCFQWKQVLFFTTKV